MAKQDASAAPAEASETKSGLGHRLSGLPGSVLRGARAKPLLAAFLICGTGIIMTAGLAAVHHVLDRLASSQPPATVAQALAQLDAGQFDEARQTAMQLNRAAGSSYARQGAALFVLGVAFADEAARHWNRSEQETLNLVAARYLEEARDRGFPRGREAQGALLLGKCLFHAGRFAESLPALRRALEKAPAHRHEIHRLLAAAYYQDQPPQLDNARKYTRLALEDRSLTDDERAEILLRQVEIELAAGNGEAAGRVLDAVSKDARHGGQVALLRARISMRAAARRGAATSPPDAPVAKMYRAAIALLRRAQAQDRSGDITRKARYLTGLCYRALHDESQAEKTLARTRRTHYHTPEALAARLAEGEIQLRQARYDVALESLLDVIDEAGRPAMYHNPWVPLKELRKRLQTTYDTFMSSSKFAAAVKLAHALANVAPADIALFAEARARAAWGAHLMRVAKSLDPPQAAVTRAEGRGHYRQAGNDYQQLAVLRFATRNYVNDLWHGGYYMLLGHNYESALTCLQRYLHTAARDDRARGLVALGEAQMSLRQLRAAEQSFHQCITVYPKHPETYRARLLAAQVYEALANGSERELSPKKLTAARKTLATAEQLLKTNLYGVSLTPSSPQWRESLFLLGQLLYREGMMDAAESRQMEARGAGAAAQRNALAKLAGATELFRQAIRRLSDYVERDPNGTHAIEARYLIAESWRQAAKYPRKSRDVEPTQARRVELTRQMQVDLQAAATQHEALQQLLNKRQQKHTLGALERRFLRNTYFARADALFDLGDYKQAIKAYSAATNRYQHEPEALEAFMQIASCYRRLQAPEQARSTVMHAIAVLSRIRQDSEFTRTTRYSRDQWNQLLTWLAKW